MDTNQTEWKPTSCIKSENCLIIYEKLQGNTASQIDTLGSFSATRAIRAMQNGSFLLHAMAIGEIKRYFYFSEQSVCEAEWSERSEME